MGKAGEVIRLSIVALTIRGGNVQRASVLDCGSPLPLCPCPQRSSSYFNPISPLRRQGAFHIKLLHSSFCLRPSSFPQGEASVPASRKWVKQVLIHPECKATVDYKCLKICFISLICGFSCDFKVQSSFVIRNSAFILLHSLPATSALARKKMFRAGRWV